MRTRQILLGVLLIVLAFTTLALLFGPQVAARDEKKGPPPPDKASESLRFAYQCRHIKATEARRFLDELLGAATRRQGDEKTAVTVNERSNTVLVAGPADRVAEAKVILQRIDVSTPDKMPLVCQLPPSLKIHLVPSGSAEALARTLQELFRKSPTVRISAAGDNRILVYASPEDQLAIAPHIPTAGSRTVQAISLNDLDAARTVEMLRELYAGGQGGPTVVADSARNAILVRGLKEQIDEVKAVLKALSDPITPTGRNVRVINVPTGDAALLAAELQRVLQQMRSNPVRVVHTFGKPDSGTKPSAAGKPGPEAKKAPGKTAPLVTLTVAGKKLIVTSDDHEALNLVQQLSQTGSLPSHTAEMTVIRLQHANAADIARILDEAFNGKSAPGTTRHREERVRIVADPSSNSLMVRASPLDKLIVHNLLENALDTVSERGESIIRTYFLGPLRHADPAETAKVVRDLYGAGTKSGITVAVDGRANSLILRCSAPVYEDVRKLVERLDVKVEKKE